MPTDPIATAVADLARRDRVLADLIADHGPPPPRRRVPADRRFAILARAIIFQQLAGSAATTIHGRFEAAVGGAVTAEAVLTTPMEALSAAGLSGAKAASVRDLAERVASGEIELTRIGRLADDDVVEHLTRVRGVGPWTAQMFMMNSLGRLDVWPTADFGVRAGFGQAWGLPEAPTPKALEVLGEPYRPYRSLVAWYCWRAADAAKEASRSSTAKKAPVERSGTNPAGPRSRR